MLRKKQSASHQDIQMISIEDLVLNDHIVRDIDHAISLDFI